MDYPSGHHSAQSGDATFNSSAGSLNLVQKEGLAFPGQGAENTFIKNPWEKRVFQAGPGSMPVQGVTYVRMWLT